jgi:hypothetical protein
VGVRIAALHGLIIALVFAQLALVYRTLESDFAEEAQTVRTIYLDAERHGGNGTADITKAARAYVAIVLQNEWHEDAKGAMTGEEAQVQIDTMFERALALPASTPREQALRDGLITDVRRLNDLHAERQGFVHRNNGAPFWFAAISGLALLAACLAPFEPTRGNLALIAGFALYSGIIFALVHSYQNPFTPPGQILPTSFEQVRDVMG